MASYVADLLHFQKQSVAVAVQTDGMYFLDMSGSFPFMPEPLFASAVIVGFPCFQCFLVGLFIHVSKHDNFIGMNILHYGSDKSAAFFKIGFKWDFHDNFLPCSATVA